MQVLALDSATNVASCGVVTPDKVLVEFNLNTKKTHSERLMPMVSEALEYADLKLDDIDGFCVSIGPGSFTGLRIGLSTIKALAFFTGKPLVGIPTLDGLAANLTDTEGLICPVLKARRDEVYCALYINAVSGQERISDYLAISPEKLVGLLSQFNNAKVTFLGDGVSMLPENIKDILGPDCMATPEISRWPRAATIGCLGLQRLQKGCCDDIASLTPLYIKASAAEDRLRKKKNTCEEK